MELDVRTARILVEDYEDAIAELSDDDRMVINVWLRAVERAVSERKYSRMGNKRANFGRASAIELLHLKLFGNLTE